MSGVNPLPDSIVQKIQDSGIPRDSIIYYKDNQWVYHAEQAIARNDPLPMQSPIDSLGPFEIHAVDISFQIFPERSEYQYIRIGQKALKKTEQIIGVYAPIAEITLQGFARSLANIPDNATHFCWLYPPYNTTEYNEMDLDDPYERSLLKLGGFAYFVADNNSQSVLQLVRVNSLVVSASNGLNFEDPRLWRREFTEQLWNQKRFQPVTLASLLEKGAKYFAFINPYESFSNKHHLSPWTPSQNGAFVYLFNSDHSASAFDCYFSVSDNCLGVAPSDAQ